MQGLLDGQNALMANLAGSMLQQQGASYLEKGQAFMQQRMGFLSSPLLQSYFSVGSSYGGAGPAAQAPALRAPGRLPDATEVACTRSAEQAPPAPDALHEAVDLCQGA